MDCKNCGYWWYDENEGFETCHCEEGFEPCAVDEDYTVEDLGANWY